MFFIHFSISYSIQCHGKNGSWCHFVIICVNLFKQSQNLTDIYYYKPIAIYIDWNMIFLIVRYFQSLHFSKCLLFCLSSLELPSYPTQRLNEKAMAAFMMITPHSFFSFSFLSGELFFKMKTFQPMPPWPIYSKMTFGGHPFHILDLTNLTDHCAASLSN